MSETLRPSEETRRRQRDASDPAASAWVSANAGSGKTFVLAQRVVRLLLAGTPPAKILCLTFTKAAAANMANRVFATLARWTQLPEEALRDELAVLEGAVADETRCRRARRLFAEALETPGGLKVLTIHAFCERVLHQFPFEANVPASFTALDERQAAELMAEARATVLAVAAEAPDGALGRALAELVVECSDTAITTALNEMAAERDLLRRLIPPHDGAADLAAVGARLAAALGIRPGTSADACNAEILDGGIEAGHWPALIDWLSGGGASDGKLAASLVKALAAADPEERQMAYLGVFFTKGWTPRDKGFITTARRKLRPDLAAALEAERDRLGPLLTLRDGAAALARSLAMLRLGDAVRLRYEEAKARRGALDFADLIDKTGALLESTDAAWVVYKLDGGLDHVLVDEAQDTSPAQWAIVRRLTAEFTAGSGARETERSVFAVGDEKQSIYSFQGAAPEKFAETRAAYAREHAGAERAFRTIELNQSFRSTSGVLAAVDRVFARPQAHAGLQSDKVGTAHEAVRRDSPGRAELWPPVAVAVAEKPTRAWDLPVDLGSAADAVHVLAERLSRAVAGWISGVDGPPVAAGDVLILVRTRAALFDAVLRALKSAGVPVAGADRLEVTAHIAVRDLLALADVLLLPDDDLALASVLKSPLFGFDDDDLIGLAPGRRSSLWRALRDAAATTPRYAEAVARLTGWAAEARILAPFDFFARLLGRDGGRRRFRARLGGEVDDPLDEFLRLALDFASAEAPSLAGFVGWMRAAPAVIKRDLDVVPEAVRVMTVHGAKGLEAKIVVLADLGEPENGRHDPKIFRLREAGAAPGLPDLLAFAATKETDAPPIAAAREAMRARALDEHRRLLYVALTRAADRLVVAGHTRLDKDGVPRVPPLSWYGLVQEGLGAEAVSPTAEAPARTVRAATAIPASAGDAAPAWLFSAATAPAATARLRPSDHPGDGAARRHGPRLAADEALRRGRLIHLLLQKLPPWPADERAAIGLRLLETAGEAWPAARRPELLDEALALMARADLAPIFAAGGRSEVAIAGRLAGPDGTPALVSGRLDRLIDDGTMLHLVDFKTDRPAPAVVPAAYVRQLALYGRMLLLAAPGRSVRASLLWTASGRLDAIDAARLKAALGDAPVSGGSLDAAGGDT